jgi:hypothetical protein
MNQNHPQFSVHDHHPGLHGLAWLVLCLLVVVAFVASVMPDVQQRMLSRQGADASEQLRT